MIVLADENITHAPAVFKRLGEVRTFHGQALSRDDLDGATVLLVRSVTRVDASLVAGSSIRFVGSATIGTDHVDVDYLRKAGIAFAHAPGSNADSVVEYVMASLLRLCVRTGRRLRGRRVGIVGCGQIGRRLARRLPHLGVEVLLNDPPLADEYERQGRRHAFRSLEHVLRRSDVVTLHVPLERQGEHPTMHLIGDAELRTMKSGAWLINSSRGPVVDNGALKRALAGEDGLARAVLDVWEGEPQPDVELVRQVDIATPHIAGYAYDAKLRGTWMLYRALRSFLGEKDPGEMPLELAGVPMRVPMGAPDPSLPEEEWLDLLVRGMYDVGRDDGALRSIAKSGPIDGARFAGLRRDYPIRREFSVHSLPISSVPVERRAAVEKGLGLLLR